MTESSPLIRDVWLKQRRPRRCRVDSPSQTRFPVAYCGQLSVDVRRRNGVAWRIWAAFTASVVWADRYTTKNSRIGPKKGLHNWGACRYVSSWKLLRARSPLVGLANKAAGFPPGGLVAFYSSTFLVACARKNRSIHRFSLRVVESCAAGRLRILLIAADCVVWTGDGRSVGLVRLPLHAARGAPV